MCVCVCWHCWPRGWKKSLSEEEEKKKEVEQTLLFATPVFLRGLFVLKGEVRGNVRSSNSSFAGRRETVVSEENEPAG